MFFCATPHHDSCHLKAADVIVTVLALLSNVIKNAISIGQPWQTSFLNKNTKNMSHNAYSCFTKHHFIITIRRV